MMSQMAFKRVSSCKPAQGKKHRNLTNDFVPYTYLSCCWFFVGEVLIQVGSPEGGLHNGGSLRAFPNDEEHMSMRTSTYKK